MNGSAPAFFCAPKDQKEMYEYFDFCRYAAILFKKRKENFKHEVQTVNTQQLADEYWRYKIFILCVDFCNLALLVLDLILIVAKLSLNLNFNFGWG